MAANDAMVLPSSLCSERSVVSKVLLGFGYCIVIPIILMNPCFVTLLRKKRSVPTLICRCNTLVTVCYVRCEERKVATEFVDYLIVFGLIFRAWCYERL